MSNSVDEAPSAVGMTGVQDYGVEGAAEEAGAGPGSHRGDTSGHHGEPLMATEDELEAFMDTYEDILAAADQYERRTPTPSTALPILSRRCSLALQQSPPLRCAYPPKWSPQNSPNRPAVTTIYQDNERALAPPCCAHAALPQLMRF